MVGISHTELAKADTAFAIIHMTLDFKRSARIDDALVVRTTYDRIKGAAALCQPARHARRRGADRSRGEAVCITLDGRPRKPTAEMLTQLAPWLAAETRTRLRFFGIPRKIVIVSPKRRFMPYGALVPPIRRPNGAIPRMDASAAAPNFSFFALFMQADWVVKAVMIGLILASLGSWAVILDKLFRFAGLNRAADRFEEQVSAAVRWRMSRARPAPIRATPCRACCRRR
jgi:hypothetical protein